MAELEAHPESGCLGTINSLGLIVQYWRSFDHLEAYARSQDQRHWPAWVAFNKRVGNNLIAVDTKSRRSRFQITGS